MGYKKTDPCIEKAFDDERLFVLMTRDPSAPLIVGEWIKQNIGKQPREKLIEALDCAIEMVERQAEIDKRKMILKGFWGNSNLLTQEERQIMADDVRDSAKEERGKR